LNVVTPSIIFIMTKN